MHHPVPDRDQAEIRQALPSGGDHLERRPQSRLVVGDSAVLTDPLDYPVNQRHPGVGLDERILQRGGAGIEHQNGI